MGLSASQAKLLSITSRLSDNELRSQSITAGKMSLANRTREASAEYMDALNSTNLFYSTFDSDGNKVKEKLTGRSLSHYGELKNQYGLINKHNQILVSETDAKNYEDSANISEFLSKYGFSNSFEEVTRTVTDFASYNGDMEEYSKNYKIWQETEPPKTIEIEKEPAYTETIPAWTETIKEGWSEVVKEGWSERVHSSKIYDAILNTGCMIYAVKNTNCYMHVMASLLGVGRHKTSTGQTFEIVSKCEEHGNDHGWCWNSDQHPVDDSLKEELKNKYPCGEVHDEYVDLNYRGQIYNIWCKDDDCDPTKSIYQKIVDLLWKIRGDYRPGTDTGGFANPEHIAEFWHIIEFDLDEVEIVEHPPETLEHPAEVIEHPEKKIHHPAVMETVENPAHVQWLLEKPKKPELAEYEGKVTSLEVKAATKEGQWYINLWHRMNGASNYKVTIDGFDNGVHDPNNDGVITGDNISSPTTGLTTSGLPLWKVLEDGLMNSAEWLQYALNNGTVSLERVDFTDPTEDGTGLADVTWKSIIWTNAADITEEENSAAVTKAEVKYKQAVTDIEAKDKQFDNRLKLLDTEHNALQTEYDSVKTVIDKNIERTLKIYS